jgi:hypothetical protein
MARLTKSEIERQLLLGAQVTWLDPSKKSGQAQLTDSKQRRLFAFLLTTRVREPTGLPPDFVDGLAIAFNATDDPALTTNPMAAGQTSSGPWRLQSIETENFGGLNTWQGGPFQFSFDQESTLLEGPNGSGKSSLIGAILWALTGERPRDQAAAGAHEPKPVFSTGDKPAGNWPPIACYPATVPELKLSPSVRVLLVFNDGIGSTAKIERTLSNGQVTPSFDPAFSVPTVIIETGLLMPARLSQLRLDEGEGRLTDAVQKLTGLDDLIAIGTLVDGLCHKTREYRSYKTKDFAARKADFNQALEQARAALAPVQVDVPSFVPTDTDDVQGAMAAFGKQLKDRAAELAQVVSGDLAENLQLSSAQTQNQVIAAISAAEADLKAGIEGLETWNEFGSIANALDEVACGAVASAIVSARKDADEAVQLLQKSAADPKFQLKAVAAKWHAEHSSGAIENCPLCEHDLKSKPSLVEQLEALRSVGNAAARTFDDNVRALMVHLEAALPLGVKKIGAEVLNIEPRTKLTNDIRANFVAKDRYARCLVRLAALVEEALASAPSEALPLIVHQVADGTAELLEDLNQRIAVIERLIALANWFRGNSTEWSEWWHLLAAAEVSQDTDGALDSPAAESRVERLMEHLSRLSDALAKAEPYRKAAEAMRNAWTAGTSASALEKEIAQRDAIAESLLPLKSLNALCEAVARDAINGLSGRISKLLESILLSEQLQFHSTQLNRKEGLVVRGGFTPDLHIDATLVANTSWLRAVLWCFLFALREEAVEQLGADPFPVMAFDDPQSTFDAFHRARWAHYVAGLQNGPAKLQIIITTYDETFLDLIKTDGIAGRQALIAAPGASCDHVTILEGASLDRAWTVAQSLNTPKAGVDYLIQVRIYIEGLLKLMLRGEDAGVPSYVLGKLREIISQMHAAKKAPWDRPVFDSLVTLLAKTRTEIKYIEGAHHSTGTSYGKGEATTVELFWRKTLRPVLERSFRTAREHRLLHGGMKALYAVPSTATPPEGYQAKVRAIPLKVLGRAAALTNGRAADGEVEMNEFAASAHVEVVLGRHFAYRLTARTLEPVARQGDILLVRELGEPTPKSLVVALSDERILARRLEIAENHNDVAVLTAQSINPREIAPPVIAHKSTFSLFKIIGILYGEATWSPTAESADEVCDCGGESVLTHLTSQALGLVEVVGQSAEPHALNGQFLIITSPIAPADALKTLEGKPIIAADNDDNCYFKRLRVPTNDQIVLESLDSGGDYPPVLLLPPGTASNSLKAVWPVVGILFERPS